MKTWQHYEKHVDLKTNYGANFINKKWLVNLWHPFAKNVVLLVYDKNNQDKMIKEIQGKFNFPIWSWIIEEDLDSYFYQYKILQENGVTTIALDPYAKSMAAFDWEGKDTKIGKAAFVKIKKLKKLSRLPKINKPQPIIYEAMIRDLTSLRNDVLINGSFNAIKEIKFAEYLKKLNFTHVQFLPIHSCYSLNENNKKVLQKLQGSKWHTNYNWGYDPHNYFSINGWYSSNPNDPYSRIKEFQNLISYMHSKKISVILDVVYNHNFTTNIFDSLIPGYYYRFPNKIKIAEQPPIASNRKMVRKLIIDSLKFFVEYYDVDGFRFDLSTFIDLQTLKKIIFELKKIKPNIVLHGEAWNWTDLDANDSFNKLSVDNDLDFAYFNDTTRNAIKGTDDEKTFNCGLLAGNKDYFGDYLASIIANLKDFKNEPKEMTKEKYHRYTNYPNNNLNYAACHDGHTLWDKVNLTISGTKKKKFEAYRQAILMQQLLQGRTLYLNGTELLYTKLTDESGEDAHRFHESKKAIDIFNYKNLKFHENTYKTTDYSCAIRWKQLTKQVKENIFDFISNVNKIKLTKKHFNLPTSTLVNKCYKFNYVDKEKLVIDFVISYQKEKLRIIHNFSKRKYKFTSSGKLLLNSKIGANNKNICHANSSILILEEI